MAFSLLRVGVRGVFSNTFERGILSVAGIHFENGTNRVMLKSCLTLPRASANATSVAVRCFAKQPVGQPRREAESDSDSDSDSDDEHKDRGTSEFWRRKIRSFHGVIDINKDGVVSYDDFKILSDRFISLGHLSSQQQKEFNDALMHVWEEQWGIVDKYNMVTTQQYLENMHHVLNDKSLKRKAHKFLPYLFKAVDKDKSGSITIAELKLFFSCLGLNQDDAVTSFKSMDMNNDGLISMKEFVKHGRDYFLTENESKPSKHFWGPLIKP